MFYQVAQKNKLFIWMLFYLLMFLPVLLFAQPHVPVPGGVGNNLRLWHLTDSLPVGGTSLTNDWPDATPSSTRPASAYNSTNSNTYETEDNLNFNSCVVLNDEWFESNLNINQNPFDNHISVFTVFKARGNANVYLWGNGKSGKPNKGRQAYTQSLTDGDGGPSSYPGTTQAEGAYINHIHIREGANNNPQNSKVYWNGEDIATIPTETTIENNGDIISKLLIGIANEDNNPVYATNGRNDEIDLAEFIVYSGNTAIDPLNRRKITSYLAIKYGITVEQRYILSTGTIVWDTAAHNYNNNIVGIANDYSATGNGNLKQNRSKSEHPGDFLELSANSSYLNPGERALVAGHDGGTISNAVAVNIGDNFFRQGRRVGRVWRCQETGGFSNYNISFNDDIFNNNTLPSGFNKQNLVLLVSTDPTFSSNVEAYEMRNNNGFQIAREVDFPGAVSYFTIANMETVTWIKADATNNNINGNSRVDSLIDQVLGVNDMLGRIHTGSKPLYIANAPNNSDMNFHSYIQFNDAANRNYIERAGLIGHARGQTSTFIVNRSAVNAASTEVMLSYATTDANGTLQNNGNSLYIADPTNIRTLVNGGSGGRASGFSSNNDQPVVISHIRGGNQSNIIGVNGVEDIANYKNGDVLRSNGTLIIGQEQDALGGSFDAPQQFNGELAEFIQFNERLTTQETDQVRTYLGVKYGLLLNHDYIASDASVIWDRTVNADYNRTIGGIGRDDVFELDQRKSRSQKPDAIVTVEHAAPFPTDTSHLLWGSILYKTGTNILSDYEVISSIGAPPGYEISERHWKVSNPGNKIGQVVVSMDAPTSVPNLLGVRLMISSSPNFNTGFISAEQGVINGNVIEFTLTLKDGEYFTLGFDKDLFYTNNELGSPSTFEACAGDSVTFRYKELPTHPMSVRFRSANGFTDVPPSSIIFSAQQPNPNGVGVDGEMSFKIPADAVTGNVLFLDAAVNGSVIFNSNAFITIHNPSIAFVPETNPICADRAIELYGFPEGGVFSSSIAGLISPGQDSLYGWGAGWSTSHDDSLDVDVTYTYYPKYTNGNFCPEPKEIVETLTIRDNRLTKLEYAYLVKQNDPNLNNKTLGVDPATISSVEPNILNYPSGAFPHPYTFTGTYVSPPPSHVLNGNLAQASNPVIFRFNNKGCIAEMTNNIDVYNPLGIPGLPDTLCADADTVYFYRDPSPLNAYLDSISGNGANRVRIEYNKIAGTFARDTAHQNAIVYADNTPGSEIFYFIPNRLPPGTTNVTLRMRYETTTTTNSGSTSFGFDAITSIVIVPRPIINLGAAIDPVYCTTGDLDTLRPNPAFDNINTTYFTLAGEDTLGAYTLIDTLFQDTIFYPSMHYDSMVPAPTRDLPIRLTYTVDRYGCIDHDTAFTNIRAPLRPFFFTKPAYCRNEDPTQLNGGILPGGIVRSGTGRFEPALGLNDSTGVFDPTVAIIGETPVTYVITDQFNCEYFYTDTLLVRTPPEIFMTLDGSRNNTSFCGSVTTVDMRSTLVSGSAIDSIRYFGAGVLDSTLNPNSVFVAPGGPLAGTGGTFPVWAVVTDSFLCKGYDTLTVTVIQAPAIDIDSVFNGRTSNYGPSNALIAEHTYCKSEPAFIINGNPLYRQGGRARGTISGAGVILIDTTYYYDPSLVPVGVEVDTVSYTYTDNVGCDNTDIAIIKLDSIPVVTLSGFGGNTSFCPNYPAIQLMGTPDTVNSRGTGTFAGPGVNPNTGVFDPSGAGTGIKLIIYEFIDNNNCVSADTVQIVVNPLPNPDFTGLKNEYCTAALDDTLYSANDTSTGTYRFYGSIIIDSTGILRPSADTTGPQTVYYDYTDSLNCTNTKFLNTFIHPTPEIVINGLDSAYCFSDPEDNISVFPSGVLSSSDLGFSASGNTITFDPDEDSAGIKTFTYIHTDNNRCSDTIIARTYVYRPAPPSILNLDTFYCETGDTILISANPLGGTFTSTGNGIWSDSVNNIWAFVPEGAGVGTHTITYSLDTPLVGYILGNGQPASLVCPADTSLDVTVRPLPLPKMISPGNNDPFCSNDPAVQLLPVNYVNKTWNFFKDTSGGVVLNFSFIYDTISRNPLIVATYPDTTYFFDPGNVVEGNHVVTYIATDSASGCSDSVQFTLRVDAYTDPFFALDSVYCESADSVLLFGIPTGGTFARNSVVIPNPPYFYPNQGYASGQYLTNTIYDTVTYSFVDGACDGIDTQIVEINPVPQISFWSDSTHNTYCLGGDTVLLTPSDSGGVFSGNGVPFQSTIFIPNLAGGGTHPISYYLMDSATGCDNEYIDTLYVYSMPNVDFSVDGGCQFDSVRFKPNNAILGLTNNSQFVDSITNVQWVMSTTFDTIGSVQNSKIDSIDYLYTTAGIYEPQLIVSNREHCTDTQTIRLVISPKISNYPYVQDFETDAGDWFAESRDSNRTLLWEWGIDSNSLGVASNPNNHIWSTQNNRGYSKEEDAWVYSPCFDITNLKRPMISLDYWSDTRAGIDGTILEYQKPDGSWARVGELDRGINWFETRFIAAEPGDDTHRNFPTGWSGQNGDWLNGRYKLDEFRGPNNSIRLRFAFSSMKNDPQRLYDGFAFDNVIIRNRTRNVLLETMVHEAYGNMENINNYIYQLIYQTPLEKDVVMLQYHIESPNGAGNSGTTDAFYNNNPSLGNTRNYEYSGPPAGRSFINGLDANQTYNTSDLTAVDFEQDMLETPKFSVSIDTFTHINNNFRVVANIKALQNMPMADYRIYVVISEDTLNYPNGSSYISQVHAVVRENDQNFLTNPNSGNLYDNRSWVTNDVQRVEFNWNHANSGFINYEPGDFHAVVFIQDIDTKEIFQVATTREVSGVWVGIDPVLAEAELNEIQGMVLFPNPAHDYFNMKFDQVLEHDYQWKLVNIQGVEVRQGAIHAGNDQFSVENLDCPAGTYILLLYNDKVFVNRKVVLGRP